MFVVFSNSLLFVRISVAFFLGMEGGFKYFMVIFVKPTKKQKNAKKKCNKKMQKIYLSWKQIKLIIVSYTVVALARFLQLGTAAKTTIPLYN